MSTDASAGFRAPLAVEFDGSALGRLARSLALVTLLLVAVLGIVVCARRATGALAEPLSGPVLAGLGCVLAVLALVFRRTLAERPRSRAAAYALWAAPSAVLAVWIAAVSLEGSSTWGLVALVGVLLVEEGWSWGRVRWRADDLARPRAADLALSPEHSAASLPSTGLFDAPTLDTAGDEAVTQQIVRRRDGTDEVIEGWVRVDFTAAQRHAAAHVAICPPLDRVPECLAEQADGPGARIKVAQVLPYGVRFEIKLDEPAEEPTSVVVEFSIHVPGDADG